MTLLALPLLAQLLAAGANGLALTWSAPPSCPSRDALLVEVGRALAGSPVTGEPLEARVAVTEGNADRWQADLELRTLAGATRRSLDAASCEVIVSATALILALAMEERAGGTVPLVVEKVPRPIGLPGPAPPAPVIAATPAAPAKAPASQIVIEASSLVDSATLPSPALGPEVGLGASFGGSDVRLRATAVFALFPSKESAVASSTGAGDFGLVTAGGRACVSRSARVRGGTFEVGPCLGAEIDRMTASGRGLPTVQDVTATWAAVTGSLLGSWGVSPVFGLDVHLGGALPATRPAFVFEGPGGVVLVHRPAPLTLRASAGISLRFF